MSDDKLDKFVELPVSLRDFFAAHALAGILGGGFADTIPHDDVEGGRQAAGFAYQYADAMIAARLPSSPKEEGR